MKDDKPLAFAGIWDTWKGEETPIESCAIITTAPTTCRCRSTIACRCAARRRRGGLARSRSRGRRFRCCGPMLPTRWSRERGGSGCVNSVKNHGPQCIEVEAYMANDPHQLQRFLDAQADDYDDAIAEIRDARSGTTGCGTSSRKSMALGSARPPNILQSRASTKSGRIWNIHSRRTRLRVRRGGVRIEGKSATQIFGSPDDLKLKSCATLFACAAPAAPCSNNC